MKWNVTWGVGLSRQYLKAADVQLFEFLRRDRGLANRLFVSISIVLAALMLPALWQSPEHGYLVALNLIAAIMAALYGGLGPGAVAGAISAVGVGLRYIEPSGPFTQPGDYLFTIVYYLSILVAGWMVCHLRTAYRKEYSVRLEAQRAVKDRDDILAIVSHDLRAPLMSIALNCRNVYSAVAAIADRLCQKRLLAIDASVHRMNDLIQALLLINKIDHGAFTIELVPGDILELIEETMSTFEAEATERQIQIKADIDRSLPAVLFDRIRLAQVLSNLVSNAMKFSATGKTVTIGARRVTTKSVAVFVKDEGAGIDPENLKNIFGRFWKSDAPGADGADKGLGLGLYISSQILKAHRSEISVESELGHGARFLFHLEVADYGPTICP